MYSIYKPVVKLFTLTVYVVISVLLPNIVVLLIWDYSYILNLSIFVLLLSC